MCLFPYLSLLALFFFLGSIKRYKLDDNNKESTQNNRWRGISFSCSRVGMETINTDNINNEK